MESALKQEETSEMLFKQHLQPSENINTEISDELVPQYMNEVYDWAYVSSANADLLDNPLTVSILLFLQDKKLLRNFLAPINPGSKMLMLAHVYGPMVEKIAQHIGKDGQFHLIDVTPVQVRHAIKKLKDIPWARAWQADARSGGIGEYDVIGSFFLLHEVPDDVKAGILNNMLSRIRPGGQAIFIDYGNPHKYHPLRPLLKYINHHLEPFAHALWENPIESFATENLRSDYRWETKRIFGGLYQRVIATKIR